MVHTLSLPTCGSQAVPTHRVQLAQVAPLAVAGAALIASVLMTTPREAGAPPVTPARPLATLMQSAGGSTASLLAAAESLRAELRAVSGVGAVAFEGLQTAGVEVRYAPSRLASLGVRDADLLASIPAEAVAPGVITVRSDVAQGGVGAVADMPVRAGQRVMRLGDVALVSRTPLSAPLARLHQDGLPAVELVVTPAQGEAGPALDRRIARALVATPLPAGVTMR